MYKIGEVIRRTRESLGIKQKDLCIGICDEATLCRIENGRQTPSRITLQALMERMGKNGERYFPYVINGPMDLLIMREEISSLVGNRRYVEANQKLSEFKKKVNINDKVNQQFIIREAALIDYRMGKISLDEKRTRLIDALKCTVPCFDGEVMPKSLFSRGEIFLFCNIAVTYAEENDFDTALRMLYQIKEYFDNTHIDLEEKSVSESFVLSNLGRCLGRNGEREEAIKVENEAIELCIDYGKSNILPSLLFNISYEIHELYNENNYGKKKLAQAYYIAEFNGNELLMDHIKKYIFDNYGMCSINQLVSSMK